MEGLILITEQLGEAPASAESYEGAAAGRAKPEERRIHRNKLLENAEAGS